jgi:hypothetical protein
MISTLDMIEVDRAAIESFETTLCEELRLLVDREAFSESSSFVELAGEFVALGEMQDALDCFGRALEKDSSCWEAYVGRAEIVQGLFIMRDEGGSEGSLGSRACADLENGLRCVDSKNRSVVFRLLLISYLLVGRYQEVKDLAIAALGEGLCEAGQDRNDLTYSLAFAEFFLGNEDAASRLFGSLPEEYEAGLFGQAVCQLRFAMVVGRDAVQIGVPERYRGSFEFLSTNGVNDYLSVARSFCAVDLES